MAKPAIKDMRNFFENPFDTSRISDDKLKKFSEEHLARLTANNPAGVFSILVTPTASAHVTYFGAISNEDVASAVRKGMTKAVDDKIAEFKTLVRKREPQIRSVFIDNEPVYLQFFPLGISEYTNASKENIETLMARMETAATTHAGQLDPATVVEFTDIHTQYQSLRTAQLGKKGEVADNKDETAAQRDVLEKQIWKNVHYLAYHYEGDVEQCMAYFDQSMLRQGAGAKDDEIDEDEGPTS
jgi:hypothetical protein